MTLVLAGGSVVAGLDPVRVIAADVLVEGDRVTAVERAATGVGDRVPTGTGRVDCAGCLVIPGNVCAHTHLYSSLARGMPYRLAPARDFVEILRRVWWRLDRALDERSIRASALVGGLEALLAGTTTLIDHHASPNAIDGSLDVVADALGSLGIRSVLAYEVTDRDGPERASAGIGENRRFAARVAAGSLPQARSMIGAHASFTLSDVTLDACVAAAAETGTGLHIHVAEDRVDQTDCRARHGTSVTERLAGAGALDERTLCAHGVHLDAHEIELVAASRATIAHNARSNMHNAVGRAPLAAMGPGCRIALGTDGIGSDMFEESRVAYLRAREEHAADDPGWALGRLAESARLAGRLFDEPLLGRVEPGAPADLVVLDGPLPAPLEAATFPGHWMFGLSSRAVRDVVVAGRVVVRNRELVLADADRLAADARSEAARLWDRVDSIPEHAFDPRMAAVP
jgi:putative selenium metabolism protein SsnA